jgi:hypothetical protein
VLSTAAISTPMEVDEKAFHLYSKNIPHQTAFAKSSALHAVDFRQNLRLPAAAATSRCIKHRGSYCSQMNLTLFDGHRFHCGIQARNPFCPQLLSFRL